MRLKGIYRQPDVIFDQYHFTDWTTRTNANVPIVDGIKVNVSVKHGHRRKLKSKTLNLKLNYGCGDPQCCGSFTEMTLK